MLLVSISFHDENKCFGCYYKAPYTHLQSVHIFKNFSPSSCIINGFFETNGCGLAIGYEIDNYFFYFFATRGKKLKLNIYPPLLLDLLNLHIKKSYVIPFCTLAWMQNYILLVDNPA
jgi:hypothetical protein